MSARLKVDRAVFAEKLALGNAHLGDGRCRIDPLIIRFVVVQHEHQRTQSAGGPPPPAQDPADYIGNDDPRDQERTQSGRIQMITS